MSQFPWEAPAIQGTMGFSFTATAVTERRWTMREQQRVEPSRRARLVAAERGNLSERQVVIRKMCYNWNDEKFGFPRLRFLMRYFLHHLSI